ncbi:transcriptional regulator domain-containing protein [Novosphingobium sp.]|uniref:transcriptional regulator domain-containing protein n=1 Tax=Novosphingobium sp. TaxID=1874826 RepID=UPI0027374547|nr:DUF6499 domain-containing protein [Novosphingobium sp.]MDP3906740.1 DUF6499 domain-containing protein [Novosphingobium sp.]
MERSFNTIWTGRHEKSKAARPDGPSRHDFTDEYPKNWGGGSPGFGNCRRAPAVASSRPWQGDRAQAMDCDPHYADLDLTDFAQEFLRRSPAYRESYARLGNAARLEPESDQCREMARTWGLVFPDPTGCIGQILACALVRRSSPHGAGP